VKAKAEPPRPIADRKTKPETIAAKGPAGPDFNSFNASQ